MKYLIVLILSILSTSKVSFQSAFGKQNVKNSADTLAFNGLVFVFSAVIFLSEVFGCSPAVWGYASIGALFNVLFQLFYMTALTIGNFSLTVLIINFSMVLNVLVSYIFFKDPISLIRFSGILMTIASFVICTDFRGEKKSKKNWLLMSVLAMLMSSAGSITQKVFGKTQYKDETAAFVSCLYIVASLLAIVVYAFFSKKGEKKTFKINFNAIKYAAMVGICLGIYQYLHVYAVATIDGTFLFPVQTGSIIIMSTLSGILIFKDKLTKKQIFGVLLGVLSVILMNF